MRAIPTAACLALVHEFEGSQGAFEATRAQDPAGNWEIGWSHKLSGPDDPLWFATFDQDQADAQALADLATAARGVCVALGDVAASLTDNQYAACIDFAYNEGVSRFAGSTLCHRIVTGSMGLVPAEFGKWVYGSQDGVEVKLNGLVRRRAAEVQVWLA